MPDKLSQAGSTGDSLKIVAELPEFDTGEYDGSEFIMASGDAILIKRIAGRAPVEIKFHRVRWHEFTALYNCDAETIRTAYFNLGEMVGSEALKLYVANDRAPKKAYGELHHYRLFLDETGSHELFAESASVI
jgi:hypothetical protein